ncbi:heavy-metal-associated domain-containing protein [Salinarimonas rosea]|uniref:heavy-metal-associated domain-containing protein n=1 Tax=Salinarimonas rosea TaxID=552063 RepID=UPI0004095769|nr:heavy-metal-associated domain-containing protein [Salinarimonas rosea]
MEFRVENMTCGGCAKSVTKAIRSADPQADVTAEPERRRVEVRSTLPRSAFEAVLKEAGYPAAPAT